MENAQCSREENGHNISVPENSSLLCFAQCGPTGLIRYLLLSDIADISFKHQHQPFLDDITSRGYNWPWP